MITKVEANRLIQKVVELTLEENEEVLLEVDEIFSEMELTIADTVNTQTAELRKWKGSTLTDEVKRGLKTTHDTFVSDISKGRILLSFMGIGDDLFDDMKSELTGDANLVTLQQIDKMDGQGHSPETIAHRLHLVVEDVEDHLNAQGNN